jgi:hypothetical protein
MFYTRKEFTMVRTTVVRRVLLLISVLVLLSDSQAESASAGNNVWTSIGPEGGKVTAFAIDPMTPTNVYAGLID